MNGSAAGPLDEALEAIRRACAHAAEIVRAMPDPRAAFEAATRLSTAIREAAGPAAQLRADSAARIWDAEQMSLAELASRIGVSKARADQLIRAAKAGSTQEGDHDG